MSRAHMLYDDTSMSALPVKITTWTGKWNPSVVFKLGIGVGYIIECKILGKSKHCIVDGGDPNNKNRYVALHISLNKAVCRKFDQKGDEIEPDFGSKKVVNTGYLMSSFKNVAKKGEDVVSVERMKEILRNKELESLLHDKLSTGDNQSTIWCEEKQLDGLDIPNGSTVRLRTKGDGGYLESIVCLDEERAIKLNYSTGESVGGSWTNKVLETKDEKAEGSHLTSESQAVDDDEWGD